MLKMIIFGIGLYAFIQLLGVLSEMSIRHYTRKQEGKQEDIRWNEIKEEILPTVRQRHKLFFNNFLKKVGRFLIKGLNTISKMLNN